MEWEYACRAGTSGRCFFPDGDGEAAEAHVWDARNSGGRVRDLRAKKPNPAGLLGMLGGVWEWTASLYRPYPAVPGDGRDDPSADGPRVLRGGSWASAMNQARSAYRHGDGSRTIFYGFRVARPL